MVGASLGRRRQRQQLVFRALKGDHLDDFEAALGHGAGLVEHHRVHLGGILQNGAAAHQDAAARQPADGRHHGRGGRQNQGARAGHDQHRDRAQPVAGEIVSERGGQQQRRQKILGVAIGQPFYGGALLLGLFHQLNDASERGFVARARDANAQQAVAVQRAGEDFVARLFVGGAEARR